MKIRWTLAAADDLGEIGEYLEHRLPEYLLSTIHAIDQAILALRDNPGRGRPGREEGTRELVLPRLPYIIVYRVMNEDIEILRIAHGARNRS